jgi:hypothetical protein
MERRSRRIQTVGIPLVFGVLAVALLVIVVNLGGSPIMATVNRSAMATINGETHAHITWDEEGIGPRETVVLLPPQYHDALQVPIVELPTGAVEVSGRGPGFQMPSIPIALLTTIIGAMLGIVVVNTMRGYGYVRGTGESGSMDPVDVSEDRGFYWRS